MVSKRKYGGRKDDYTSNPLYQDRLRPLNRMDAMSDLNKEPEKKEDGSFTEKLFGFFKREKKEPEISGPLETRYTQPRFDSTGNLVRSEGLLSSRYGSENPSNMKQVSKDMYQDSEGNLFGGKRKSRRKSHRKSRRKSHRKTRRSSRK